MAKQSGIIKLEGTIGDISFYKTQDGMLARQKGGVSGTRILSDPSFARTRENMDEFSRAGSACKVLRTAFRLLILDGADNRLVSRLTKGMMSVIKSDPINARGQRNVMQGDLEQLRGFDFNINAALSATVFFPFVASIDKVTGALKVTIAPFVPINTVTAPEGASHMKLVSGGAFINFETGANQVVTSASQVIKIDNVQTAAAIELLNQLPANIPTPLFLVFGIEFYQQVNGVDYSLKNGKYNALSIVKVEGTN